MAAISTGALKLCYSGPVKQGEKVVAFTKLPINFRRCISTARLRSSFPIRALEPKREGGGGDRGNSSTNNSSAFTSQEDLAFLWKLTAGSFGGAAIIKYGSVLFPEITSPNIVLALVMISTPVFVAVLLLIKETRTER